MQFDVKYGTCHVGLCVEQTYLSHSLPVAPFYLLYRFTYVNCRIHAHLQSQRKIIFALMLRYIRAYKPIHL